MKDLSLEHYKQLKEGSGITDELIELRPYKTITDAKELLRLGFSRVQANNVPGLLLPVNCTDGTNGLATYRPDIPRVITDRSQRDRSGEFKTRVIKYEMPPKVGVRLDCPKVCRANGGLVDPDRPLWITEGQKKADALASRGLIAIALLGVWNFVGKNTFGGVSLLADFDYVTWKGRDVRVVFDSDVMTKQAVRKALDRLTEHLQRKGAHVAVVHLPMDSEGGGKVGVDDYLLTHSVEELEALIEGPRPQVKVAAPTIELIEDEPFVMRRPIALVNGKAFVAIWPLVKTTTTETRTSSGDIIKLDKPLIEQDRRALVMREDGQIFSTSSDGADDDIGFECLPDLEFQLDTIPEDKHRWSTPAIIKFRGTKNSPPQRPNPSNVFKRIVCNVDHYIDFDRSLGSQETMSEMVACYIMATWFLDAFQVIGYLYPNGEFGSGKSELLNTVTLMSFMGEMVMAQSTIATIRDAADYGGTLAFDEVERLQQDKTKADLVAILLAGNRRGASLACKEPGTKDGKWVTKRFNCFCPRLFAATRLPDGALATRSIVVPLVRSVDASKPNRMVTAVESWPNPRRELIDDLWALTLGHLSKLKDYDDVIGKRARLKGRQLEPWRAILAVAMWLEESGVEGLWERIHTLAINYQAESQELDSTSLTRLVVRALDRLMGTEENDQKSESPNHQNPTLFSSGVSAGVSTIAGVDTPVAGVSGVFSEDDTLRVKTSAVLEECKSIVQEEEIPIREESLNNRSIGWIMKRLRFSNATIGHSKIRGWVVSYQMLERHKMAFGLFSTRETPRTQETTPATPATPAETPADQKAPLLETVKSEQVTSDEWPEEVPEYFDGETEEFEL